MHEKHVFTFMRINDMGIKQVVKMEYTLLKYINRVWVSGVTMVIEFISGKSWEELKFTSGTGQFSEKLKQTDAGVYYTSEMRCNMIGDDKETLTVIDKLEHADIVVCVTYNSGERKVIGARGTPVKLVSEINVSKSGGYKLTFACDSINRGCFLKV